MKNVVFKFTFLIIFLPTILVAKEKLNSMDAALMRFPSLKSSDHFFVNPSTPSLKGKKKSYHFKVDAFFYGNEDLRNLYDELSSDNDEVIANRINESYGKPYNALARLGLIYQNKDFQQSIMANGGEVFILNNPSFPELTGTLLIDFSSRTSYNFKLTEKVNLEPSLLISRRKTMREKILASQVLIDKQSYKLNQVDWYTSFEGSLFGEFEFSESKLFAEVRSIPISGQQYSYWDTILGLKTLDLSRYFKKQYLSNWNFYIQYSPLYGGDYHIKKTYLLGSHLSLGNHLHLDMYLSGNYYFNLTLKVLLENFEISFYSKKDSYDDYFLQESRSIGMNTRFQF